MGFLTALTGGSSSSSKSGYSALPKDLKKVFGAFGPEIGQYTNPANPGVIDAFTPMPQTADETAAFSAIRGGFAPTADSLGADMSMLQNPYNTYVMDEINRSAGGDYSILKQALSEAGQTGASSSVLTGANDIDRSRINTIGGFLQSQYNNNLGHAMNTLPALRAADAKGLIDVGAFQRALQSGTSLAPVAALQAGTGLMSPFLTGGKSSSEQIGGILPALSNAAGSYFGAG